MVFPLSITLSDRLELPVTIIYLDDLPKVIAGGVPVTPINVALGERKRYTQATRVGLDTYARAGRLYSELCAHLGSSIIDVSNSDFHRFKDGLLGYTFPNHSGQLVTLESKRGRGAHTADLMIVLTYSLGGDIERLYGVRFDWRRFGNLPTELVELIRAAKGGKHPSSLPREHKIKWTPRKITGLPDEQFKKLIDGAKERWYDTIAAGDMVYAPDPEAQRGALFFRNLAILFLLRYEGSRRTEAIYTRFCDIRRSESKLYLVTKGSGGQNGERLPVVLFPCVSAAIWHYATKFRPDINNVSEEDKRRVFLSHSVNNYGEPIGHETVRKLVEGLREFLDPPWNRTLPPHILRHAFGYGLQKCGLPSAQLSNMRHKSASSGEPYRAGIEVFAEELIEQINKEIELILTQTGFHQVFEGGAQ
jgi:integrase